MRYPTLPFPLSSLRVPVRDALRGLATFADATEDTLQPAMDLLPEGLRTSLHSALERLEASGQRWMDASIVHMDICVASDVVAGRVSTGADQEACARVIAFAWDHLRPIGQSRLMISETLLATRLSSDSAAHLYIQLRTSSVIGTLPGVPAPRGAEDQEDVDLRLFALMIWLLAARADTLEDEQKLLHLAGAMSVAMKAEILAAVDQPDQIAEHLQALSDHL